MTDILVSAILLDWLLADPFWLYHPVQMIGVVSIFVENKLRRIKYFSLYFLGIVHWLSVIFFFIFIFLILSSLFKFWGQVFINIFYLYLTYSLLAFGSLLREVSAVNNFLAKGDLSQARKRAQDMVSRNLTMADENEIVRATIETATENLSDGIITPLFYFGLGGPFLMLIYKIINTLDSMVGYKTEKYLRYGWCSARMDDLFNLIPARLTGFLILFIAWLIGDSFTGGWRAWMRDAQRGPSPNGGIPITVYAGVRNIRLGGPCLDKNGQKIDIPYVGGANTFDRREISRTIFYLYAVSICMAIIILLFII